MTLKEKIMEAELAYQRGVVAELSTELKRIARKNTQLKAHLQIIAGIPYSRTADRLREKYAGEMFPETIINLN